MIINGRQTTDYEGELERCPLCKREPQMNVITSSGTTIISIKCACGLRYSTTGTVHESRKAVIEKAIRCWNSRPELPPREEKSSNDVQSVSETSGQAKA